MSGKQDWRTPPWFFEQLDDEFEFSLDAAGPPPSRPTPTTRSIAFFKDGTDALSEDWKGRVFVNPPYRWVEPWVRKASESAKAGALVVMLLMPQTDTKWFHRYIWDKRLHRPREGVEVRFLEGRLRFHGDQGTPLPAPRYANMLVVFHPADRADRAVSPPDRC